MSSSRRKREQIALQCQALMHANRKAHLTLDDGTKVRGRVDVMSLNGPTDPASQFDPVTVTIAGQPIALGRITEVQRA